MGRDSIMHEAMPRLSVSRLIQDQAPRLLGVSAIGPPWIRDGDNVVEGHL
jgi:hypothetical protein